MNVKMKFYQESGLSQMKPKLSVWIHGSVYVKATFQGQPRRPKLGERQDKD